MDSGGGWNRTNEPLFFNTNAIPNFYIKIL